MHQEPDVYIRQFTWKEVELTPGGLHGVQNWLAMNGLRRVPDRHAGVSRGHIKAFHGRDVEGPNGKEWLLRILDS